MSEAIDFGRKFDEHADDVLRLAKELPETSRLEIENWVSCTRAVSAQMSAEAKQLGETIGPDARNEMGFALTAHVAVAIAVIQQRLIDLAKEPSA